MYDPATLALLRSELLRSPRLSDPKRLQNFGWKAHSQDDEDGMLAEIFRRIGTVSKSFIEVGVQDGLECNTAALLLSGWTGTWIEGSGELAAQAKQNYTPFADRLQVVPSMVTRENIDALLKVSGLSDTLDLLTIDIDSNDYWVWDAVKSATPRVVVMEYNGTYPPPISITIDYNPEQRWQGNTYYGASLGALVKLAIKKGYSLVGCSLTGVNAFFVRDDLLADKFAGPYTAENHFEPPRHFLIGHRGHPPAMGPWTMI